MVLIKLAKIYYKAEINNNCREKWVLKDFNTHFSPYSKLMQADLTDDRCKSSIARQADGDTITFFQGAFLFTVVHGLAVGIDTVFKGDRKSVG